VVANVGTSTCNEVPAGLIDSGVTACGRDATDQFYGEILNTWKLTLKRVK